MRMRVMVIIKATRKSESGAMPRPELLEAMGRFNEELVSNGVMVSGEGLRPSSAGRRVRIVNGRRHVTNGPFTPVDQLMAGFWIWKVDSLDAAVEWVQRCPDPMPGEESEIEIRPLFEFEDFA
jgi:hypothetical protein